MRITRTTSALAAAAVAAAIAVPAASAATSVPAQAHYRGTTYGALAADWWNWTMAQTAAESTVLDTTGALCQEGDVGKVFLLAGSGSSDPVARTCTVPTGTPLFVVAFDTVYSPLTGDPEPLEQGATNAVDAVTDVSITVDGRAVRAVRAVSPRFTMTAVAGNIFGAATGSGDAVAAGYYALLTPLPPGTHVIHARSSYPPAGFSQDITYTITVVPGR